MTNLQKLIDCWRPIEDFIWDSKEPLNNHVLVRVLLGYEDAEQITTATFLQKDEHFFGEGWYEQHVCTNDDCYNCVFEPIKPTHYMPLDTPEKLAKIVGVLEKTLGHWLANGNEQDYQVAMDALQQAEKIAGGE